MTTASPSMTIKQPRRPRAHRHSKSASAINTTATTPSRNAAPQPRSQPHHHNAHQLNNPPPRAQSNHQPQVSPQTPKPEKRRRRGRGNKAVTADTPADSVEIKGIATPAPINYAHASATAAMPSPPAVTPHKIYAGPQFKSSPAPESLPVPKFISKSVPAPSAPGLQAMLEADSSIDDTPPDRPLSHLEKLFQADREERALGKVSPPDSSDNESSSSSSSFSDDSNRDLFGMEPESPLTARFSGPQTPPSERVRPHSSTDRRPGPPSGDNDLRAMTTALRQFLFQSPTLVTSPKATPSTPPAGPFRGAPRGSPHSGNVFGSPQALADPVHQMHKSPPHVAPRYRATVDRAVTRPPFNTSPTPIRQTPRSFFEARKAATPGACANDLTDMENTLRRMLKIEAPGATTTSSVMI